MGGDPPAICRLMSVEPNLTSVLSLGSKSIILILIMNKIVYTEQINDICVIFVKIISEINLINCF